MNKKILLFLALIIVIVLVGGYYLFNKKANGAKQQPATPASDGSSAPSSTNTAPASPLSPAGSSSENKTSEIAIKNFAFNPDKLKIKAGATVKWTNQDSVPHQIKAGSFNSDVLGTGDSFEFRFSQPGSYDYACGIHPSMKGNIIVE